MHNTGNPLGSTSLLDLYDNSETIDNFVNSQQDETPDRFGQKRLTLAGLIRRSMALRNEINDFSGALTFRPEWSDVPMNVSEGVGGEGGALNLQAEALGNRSEINKVTSREALRRSYAEAGYNLVSGSFEAGGTLTTSTDVLLFEADGKAYSWGGTLPKVVPVGSTPSSSGGIGAGAWTDRSTAPIAFKQSGTGAVPRTAQDKMREVVSVKDFGAVGDGVTDDTAAIQAAITAGGVGATILFFGISAISSTIRPLSRQTWVGADGACDLYFTGTSANPAVEFDANSSFASIENIGFRATTAFTGPAFQFANALNCVLEGSFIRNTLNGVGVKFNGMNFYNEVNNVKMTLVGVGLYVTGNSPSVSNNNIVNNMDIYGASDVGIAMYSDGNPTMFTLNNFISEAECSTAVLKLLSGNFEFNSPRFECTATPAEGFYNITGAGVTFNGQKFDIQKAVHDSIASDLDEIRFKTLNNLVVDPLFVTDLASGGTTPPAGWTVVSGSVASYTKSTDRPEGVAAYGNSLEVVTSAATTILQYEITDANVLAAIANNIVDLYAITKFSAPGTQITIQNRYEQFGGLPAGGVVSEQLKAGTWGMHSTNTQIASNPSRIQIRFVMYGSGGTFKLWTPLMQLRNAHYRMAAPSNERPWLRNGMYFGTNGNAVFYGTAAPVSGTWKVGDRMFNQAPAIGQPKSWVCTVAGTPGTWVSEGNL